jgi:predicted Zn-dependent protease
MVLADAYQNAGDRPRAVAQYETIEKRGAATPILLNNLAWLYYEMGDARAEAVARRAYEAARDVAAVADTYGWILVEAGKAEQALEPLRRAAADTSDPAVQYHLAVALIRTGAGDEGRRRLTELLQRAPEFNGASEARKLLESGG